MWPFHELKQNWRWSFYNCMVGIVFLWMISFFPCMTFTKGVAKTTWNVAHEYICIYHIFVLGELAQKKKVANGIRWEASRLLAVQSWREKQPNRCTQFFFVQANPCNITSNICIQFLCRVIQEIIVPQMNPKSDKLCIPMVWPGISQTSIGETNPKSLMIKKRPLCRLLKFTLIQDPSWIETPQQTAESLKWSKSKTRVVKLLHEKDDTTPKFWPFVSSSSKFGVAKNHNDKRYRV